MSCRVPGRNELFSTCPSDFRPVVNKAVASFPVRLTFYMQTLLVFFNGAVAAQLEPPVKSDDDRKPRTPRQKLERKMKKLERRRKSGMEAFTILMAMNIAMAFTSYVLAFAPRHTLDFHSALIVLYLLVLSWVAIVSVAPFYLRLKVTLNTLFLKLFIFVHNCSILIYILALLARAPLFGPSFCCNSTAKGVIFVGFSALGSGRTVGWVVSGVLISAYFLHLSGFYTLPWMRPSEPKADSTVSPQIRKTTVLRNNKRTTANTGASRRATEESKVESTSEKANSTEQGIVEVCASLPEENVSAGATVASPLGEAGGDTTDFKDATSVGVLEVQSVNMQAADDADIGGSPGTDELTEEILEDTEFIEATGSANLRLLLGYFIFWLAAVANVELLIFRNNFLYDIEIDINAEIGDQVSMSDAINFAQTLQFSQVLTFFIPFVHVHDTVEKIRATYLSFKIRHAKTLDRIGQKLNPSSWFSSKTTTQGNSGPENV